MPDIRRRHKGATDVHNAVNYSKRNNLRKSSRSCFFISQVIRSRFSSICCEWWLMTKKHFDENSDYDGVREKIYSENASALLDRQEER